MGLPMAPVFVYSVTAICCASLVERGHTNRKGEFFVKRLVCLATSSLVAMLILVPAALAQNMVPGDDHPHLPEPNAVEVSSHEELERIAGQPVPSQNPGEPPDQVPASPSQGGLPKTGGPSVGIILPAGALLLVGSGVLVYAVLRRGLEGGSVQ
jgi:hypothetical protein